MDAVRVGLSGLLRAAFWRWRNWYDDRLSTKYVCRLFRDAIYLLQCSSVLSRAGERFPFDASRAGKVGGPARSVAWSRGFVASVTGAMVLFINI